MISKLSRVDRRAFEDALAESRSFKFVTERHALVDRALGGFRLGQDRMNRVQWDGSPTTVANTVMEYFDGLEVDSGSGIPALALLAEELEKSIDSEQRAMLEEMRQRLRWGKDPDTAAKDLRRIDRRSPGIIRERAFAENSLSDVVDLQRAIAATEAVVRISQGGPPGTGFLIAPDLMLTAHHVIPNSEAAARAEMRFFYQSALDGTVREGVSARVADNGLLCTSDEQGLDVSLLRLKDAPPLEHYLLLNRRAPADGERVAVIQHPGGGTKKIGWPEQVIDGDDHRYLQYFTSTEGGSSGSPVFNQAFEVVAVHHAATGDPSYVWANSGRQPGGPKEDDSLRWRNQGSKASEVVVWLRETVPGALGEVRVLD